MGDIILSCPSADRMPNIGKRRQRLQIPDLGLTTMININRRATGSVEEKEAGTAVAEDGAMRGNEKKYHDQNIRLLLLVAGNLDND
jgi:hypothetical protein